MRLFYCNLFIYYTLVMSNWDNFGAFVLEIQLSQWWDLAENVG